MAVFEVIAKRGLRVRELPSSTSAVLERMPNGMQIERVDDKLWNHDWYKIFARFTPDYAVRGYAHRTYLERVSIDEEDDASIPAPATSAPAPAETPVAQPVAEEDTPDDIYRVVASSLMLRDAPKTGKIIMRMDNGTLVTKLAESETEHWWKVSTKAGNMVEEGFTFAKYLTELNPKPAAQFDLSVLSNVTAAMTGLQKFVGDYANALEQDLLLKLNEVVTKYGINANAKRFTHFVSQLAHESANFTVMEENLYYSADRLMKVFGRYFTDKAEAETFAKQPEKIANRVYANRIGNGDEASGDGYRYRGRGFIQLTGRGNYRAIGRRVGLDLEGNPDQVSGNLSTALLVAADFWDSRGLNQVADTDDVYKVTKIINGGYNGIEHRKQLLQQAKAIWGG